MKTTHYLLLLIGLLNLLTFSSCSDDDKDISADTNIPITGYWQIAGTSIENGADINGDGTAPSRNGSTPRPRKTPLT